MPVCLKNRYPFRLATTSFIHRAGYAQNVRQLAPWLDEIELLFLECDHLPADTEIAELRQLADAMDISYNIHLPMDISIADPSPSECRRSRDAVLQCLERTEILAATGYVLHVNYRESDNAPDTVQSWQIRTVDNLGHLMEKAGARRRKLCVETLDFPPHWLDAVVSELNVPVCMDVGHVIRFGFDLENTLERFADHIRMFHLHGVSGGRDHLCLDHLHCDARDRVARFLKTFRGSVSLEVFSYEDWENSMVCFERMMTHLESEPKI